MSSFFDSILHAIQAAWSWLIGVLQSIGNTVIGWIMSLIPNADVSGPWNTISFAIDAANQWAPISEAITFATAYITFVVGFLTIKILIKLIP
jgi:hypothetical protein